MAATTLTTHLWRKTTRDENGFTIYVNDVDGTVQHLSDDQAYALIAAGTDLEPPYRWEFVSSDGREWTKSAVYRDTRSGTLVQESIAHLSENHELGLSAEVQPPQPPTAFGHYSTKRMPSTSHAELAAIAEKAKRQVVKPTTEAITVITPGGHSAPQFSTLTSVDAVAGLPAETIIRNADGQVFVADVDSTHPEFGVLWYQPRTMFGSTAAQIRLPATLVFHPAA